MDVSMDIRCKEKHCTHIYTVFYIYLQGYEILQLCADYVVVPRV